jgi:hypothetical protein
LEKLVQKDIEVWGRLCYLTNIFFPHYAAVLIVVILIYFVGSLPHWADRWGCHSEFTDIQREEICRY